MEIKYIKSSHFKRLWISIILVSVVLASNSCSNEESIVVTYFPGLPVFYKEVIPPVFEEVTNKPCDTLYISKETYRKLKEYASSKEAYNHSNNVDVRLLMAINTTKTYFGMLAYGYNPSDKVLEMEYLIKSVSNYYNFISRDNLDNYYCQEIRKYGIPKDYHYIDRSKFRVIRRYYRYLLLVE